MTHLDSRKVTAGRVRRLVAFVGDLPPGSPEEDREAKWFSLWDLIQAIAKGCGRFIGNLNANPARIDDFIKRYDLIVSDARYYRVVLNDDNPTCR